MDKLVEKLPTLSFANRMDVIYFENEGNVMTTTQVAAAKAKNWIPYYAISDSEWEEYAGTEPLPVVITDELIRDSLVVLSQFVFPEEVKPLIKKVKLKYCGI